MKLPWLQVMPGECLDSNRESAAWHGCTLRLVVSAS
jgi:hypothetical protein